MSESDKQKEALQQSLLAIKKLKARIAELERVRTEPIAVIGMGCRLPGQIDSAEAFWAFLAKGGDGVSEIPLSRFDFAKYYDPRPDQPAKIYTKSGGFLGEIDQFDANFFGIPPREAMAMDPQQRILLEVSFEALEDASIPSDSLNGSKTGVYVGMVNNDYADLQMKSSDPSRLDAYCGTGTYASVLAGRISFTLGAQGPCIAVDTACSTSLVAIHQAIRGLRGGECDLALAGGVNLLLSPNHYIYYCQLKALAADGRCKAFDDAADGFVKAEGCGVLVLKRLSDAQRDGDRILGLLLGSAVNHDGRSSGLTVPNGPAQEAVIRQALSDAGVSAERIGFVEAHGTGTSLGDPIEVQALLEVLRQGGQSLQKLVLGSVKTNLGHTESAAGVTGLIKALLAVRKGAIPANLHFEKRNHRIFCERTELLIPTSLTPWPQDAGDLAAVSSIGIGGTNAHLILGPAPSTSPSTSPSGTNAPAKQASLLTISARSQESLRALAQGYQTSASECGVSWSALCAAAARNRAHYPFRLALPARSGQEAAALLDSYLNGQPAGLLAQGQKRPGREAKLVFYFPGQGSQWARMGMGLFEEEPSFRAKLEACDRACQQIEGWSILAALRAPAAESKIDETAIAQPAIFAIQVSLAALWRARGIVPDAVLGHSMGEVAAAHVAGALCLEDAIRVICRRSAMVRRVAGKGAMALVEQSAAQMQARLVGLEQQVSIAAHNGPRSVVLSGEPAPLEELLEALTRDEIFCRRVNVDYASHCAQMDPLMEDLRKALAEVRPCATQIPFYSTVTCTELRGELLDAGYWARNLRAPVLFHDQILALKEAGHNAFIELSPHPILTFGVDESVASASSQILVSGCMRRDEDESVQFLRAFGALYAQGYDPDWAQLFPQRCAGYPLPSYAWNRRRFWPEFEDAPASSSNNAQNARTATAGPRLILRSQLEADAELCPLYERLAESYGLASRTIGQATGKRYLFFNAARNAMIYLNARGHSIVALNFTGEERGYESLVHELSEFASARGLELSLLEETAERVERLAALGFSTTVVGTWQTITDLANFSLKGNSMRRLRYSVSQYEREPGHRIEAYRFGTDPEKDRVCLELMDAWAETKAHSEPLISHIKSILHGHGYHRDIHLFLIGRAQGIDGLVMISPSYARNGYLLDMEFYRPDAPQGCMEFGIVKLLDWLASEGRETFTLGLTMGTRLEAHPNEDPAVRSFYEQLQEEGVLNGNSNFQFKNKFRAQVESAFLCRPRGLGSDHLSDFVLMLGDPTNATAPGPDLTLEVRVNNAARGGLGTTNAHPLLPARLDLAQGGALFEGEIARGKLAFLSDHGVFGYEILPATAFAELVLSAAKSFSPSGALAELTLGEPLELALEARRLQLSFEAERDGLRAWSLSSRGTKGWARHAEGRWRARPSVQEPGETLQSLRERLSELENADAFYAARKANGYEYGPAYRLLRDLRRGDGEILARIEAVPPDSGLDFAPQVLDACLQAGLALLPALADPDQIYLPLQLSELCRHRHVISALWVHVRRCNTSSESPAIAMRAFDETGHLVFEVGEVVFRAASGSDLRAALSSDPELLELGWEKLKLKPGVHLPTCLLFGSETRFNSELATALEKAGRVCYRVRHGASFARNGDREWTLDSGKRADFEQLAKEFAGQPLDLLLLPPLQSPHGAANADPVAETLAVCEPALHLAQAFAARAEPGVSLRFVTRGAQAIQKAEPVALAQAALWGLARVIASETPELFGGILDLDAHPANPGAALEALVEWEGGDEAFLAWRGAFFAPRLKTAALVEPAQPSTGPALITGGLGALGLELAAWLVGKGCRHLVLCGRSAASAEAERRLQGWREAGVTVQVEALDLSEELAVQALFARLESAGVALNAIHHAAGLLDDGLLDRQDSARFRKVLAPKLAAVWLDRYSRKLPIREFVLFSSASPLLGPVGQANYAAANAALDAIAHARQAEGLPALSINWGRWGKVGLASGAERGELVRLGLRAFDPSEGLCALAIALASGAPQRIFCPLDPQRLVGEMPHLAPLLRPLLRVQPSESKSEPSQSERGLPNLQASEPQRSTELRAYLRARVALALGAIPAELDEEEHFSNMGLNSLMVMELRNKIRDELKLTISPVKFFKHPSVVKLSEAILAELPEPSQTGAAQKPIEAASEPAAVEVAEELSAASLEGLSDDQVDALLQQMLLEQGGQL